MARTKKEFKVNTEITKNSLSIQELATTLQAEQKAKRDFLCPSSKLWIQHEDEMAFKLDIDDKLICGVGELFHDQLSAHYKIPKPYYERIREEFPSLLETTLNTHFEARDEVRLVRTLHGNARAFLSNSYRPLDNVDLMTNAILPALASLSDINELRFDCQLTEYRMHVKAVFPKVQGEIKKGDIVQAGVIIRNSEVGHSALAIEPFILRLVCMNGLVMPIMMRKFHAGRRNNDVEAAQELVLSDRTKMLRDAQTWSEVRDLIVATSNEVSFNKLLEPMKEAADRPMENKPTEAVEVVAEWYGFNDDEKASMLDNLIRGGDMSHWGIVNAVTAMAHTEDDYESATELQQIGGELLQLDKKELKALLTA